MCNENVRIGFGGEKNWNQHAESKKHLKKASQPPPPVATKPIQKATQLTTFFAKLPLRQSRSPPADSGIKDPPQLSIPSGSNSLSIPGSDTAPETAAGADANLGSAILPIDVDLHDRPPQSVSNAANLLKHIRAATFQLPTSIPAGSFADSLSRFSGDLEAAFASEEYESMWEMVDKELNRAIGFEKSIAEIGNIIRRGRLGMDGLCDWLSACLDRSDIPPELLEPKLSRLLEAIRTL